MSTDAEEGGKLLRAERRTFLRRAAFAAGAAVSAGGAPLAIGTTPQGSAAHETHANARQFQCFSEAPRRRKSFYDLSDAEVRTLCREVGYMRNGLADHPLSVDSPIQWDQWAMTTRATARKRARGLTGPSSWHFLGIAHICGYRAPAREHRHQRYGTARPALLYWD